MAVMNQVYTNRMISDSEIIKKILHGEKELYEIIVLRYNQSLYRVLRGYLKEEKDVEDTMQETYINAFQKLNQFRGEASIATWLIRIGINEALRHLKRNKRERKDLFFQVNLSDSSLQIIDKMDPEKKKINGETAEAIEVAIGLLSPKYRSVFIMREVEGMSIREIAECLGIESTNVKVRLHRAKKILKDNLTDVFPLEEIYAYGNKYCDLMTEKVINKIMNL